MILTEIPVYLDEPIETPAVTGAAIYSSEPAAINSVEVDGSNLPVAAATHLVAADGASCPVASTTNSVDDDDLATGGDDVEMLSAAMHGIKRRWSFEENTVFKRAFLDALSKKQMPSGEEIMSVSKEMGTRTVAQIRTRLNNIMLGKQKWFC